MSPEPSTGAESPARLGKLPRNVVVLSWVSLFQDAASEMLYPVMPLFLTGVLGAPVAVVGLVEGVAEGTASVMKAVSGRLADVRRRRPLVTAGYATSALSKLAIGLAVAWPHVLAARVGDRVGKGLRTSPRDALIAAETPAALRGRAFGLHRAFDTAGAVIGPLVGLALYVGLGRRLRPVFFAAFVPAAVSVLLTLLVREPARDPARRRDAPRDPLPARYWRVLAFVGAFGLVNFSDALLILRARGLGLSFVSVILVYALYNVSYAALSYPAGRVSDHVPRRWVFAAGLGVFAAAYLGLGVVTTPAWVWVLLPVYGAYTALTDGVARAWVADLLPPGSLGSGIGLYHAATGVTALIAGIWAGAAWQGSGRLPLVVSGATAGTLALVLVAGGRRLERA